MQRTCARVCSFFWVGIARRRPVGNPRTAIVGPSARADPWLAQRRQILVYRFARSNGRNVNRHWLMLPHKSATLV